MDPKQVTTMAKKFQSVLDAAMLNERGKQLGLSECQRLITPLRLGLSVGASMATKRVQSIADFHRQCNELWEAKSD
jgi:hypothetical protein